MRSTTRTPSRLRTLVRHHPRSDQRGYILALTLAIVFVFALLAVSLLSLLFTDVRARSAFAGSQRLAHAVDSALTTGLNKLKVAPSGDATDPASACSTTTLTIDRVDVDVTCGEVGTPLGAPWAGHAAITTVGGFSGPAAVGANAVFQGALSGPVSLLLGNIQTWLSGNAPGLIHYGPSAVQTIGDVNVSAYGFGIVDHSVHGAENAFDVIDGSFHEAGRDPFATGDPCGALSPTYPVAALYSGYRFSAVPRAVDQNPAGDRQCGTGAPVTPLVAPPATSWVPGVLPTCAPGTVVTIPPGSYGWAQVQVLNSWFGAGNCDGVTFYFPPGDYHFDASGTVPAVGGDISTKSAVVFDDPTSTFVFGTPSGWSPPGRATANLFPAACDLDAAGVSITLSSRTTIQHHRGLLAACGRRNATGEALPVVYQDAPGAGVAWAAEPAGASSAVDPSCPGICPAYVTTGSSTPSGATASASAAPAGYPALGAPYDRSESPGPEKTATMSCNWDRCRSTISFADFFHDTDDTVGDLSAATLRLKGSNTNAVQPSNPDLPCGFLSFECSSTSVTLSFHDNLADASAVTNTCTVKKDGVPKAGTIFDIDLRAACGNVTFDASQLRRASVSITQELIRSPPPPCGFWFLGTYLTCPSVSASIDYTWIEATTLNQAALPMALTEAVDASTSANFFGPVYLPRTQIIVRWNGTVSPAPVFAGGVVAQALASATESSSSTVGVLAAPRTKSIRRLRAYVGTGLDRRLRGTADVTVSEQPLALADGSTVPYRKMAVLAWRLCSVAAPVPTPPAASGAAPNCP